jgi:crotonobetainyl-CoA:carnitine CoA-transferase CaiB-like acyl-CoA transferase
MILAVGNDKQFEKFCQIADLQNLPTDPRYKTNAARVENRLELTKILQDTIQQKTLNWWIENLEKEHVPCGPINTIDRVFEDPQVMHRNMKVELDHATAGKAPSVGSPLKFSETPVAYDLAPPTLGQHTDSVLREILKIDPDQIKHLSECGIIDLGS